MSGEDDDYFSSIGNKYSGSQDPEEQNRALEREAEKRRREQEREQARLLREQQAAQAELQKSLQQTAPNPVYWRKTNRNLFRKPTPTIPLMGYRVRNEPTSCYTNTIIAIRTIIRVNDSHRIEAKSI